VQVDHGLKYLVAAVVVTVGFNDITRIVSRGNGLLSNVPPQLFKELVEYRARHSDKLEDKELLAELAKSFPT
jgi:hypothetical protein